MVSINDIKSAAENVNKLCPIKSMSLFGSYANGTASATSDIDISLEINKDSPTFFDFGFVQYQMQKYLNIKVDVIPVPLKKGTKFKINKMVKII